MQVCTFQHKLAAILDRPAPPALTGTFDEAAQLELSEKLALAEKGNGLTVTARFKDLDDLKTALARLGPNGSQQPAE